ncbi:UDP-glucose:glycoprotein glucosyltransferase-domain-containing protein [Mycena galopus ATCC 62051]|nr:UDP-glucose:glycoprotein glucosyltransferase-domain-containing protein [Mycena galopus ATCC 62051]
MKQRRRKALLATAATCLAWVAGTSAKSPPVKVTLESSWPAPPLLLEIIETVALENPDAFFQFVDRVTDPDVFPQQALTQEATHQYALQVAAAGGWLAEPGALAAVEMNLGLHAATPRIEAFYHRYAASETTPCAGGSWVDWYGKVVCDVGTLVKLVGVETIEPSPHSPDNTHTPVDAEPPNSYTRPALLAFDHVLPTPARTLPDARPPRTAILYAALSDPNFRALHSYLFALARREVPPVEYVFRHAKRNTLSGYGVSLDLKKMDYLALDDRHAHAGSSHTTADPREGEGEAEEDSVMKLIEAYPEPEPERGAQEEQGETQDEEEKELKEAKEKEAIAALGFQAAQLIADSADPLSTLTRLAQNLPAYLPALSARVRVNASLQAEIHANQLKAQAGVHVFWLNGAAIARRTSPAGAAEAGEEGAGRMGALTGEGGAGLGLTREEARALLTHEAVSAAEGATTGVVDGVFDASDREEGGGVVVWWNDLEKDSRYAAWSPSIHAILRPLYPGQFHNVALNLFNTIFVLNSFGPDGRLDWTAVKAGFIAEVFDGIVPAPPRRPRPLRPTRMLPRPRRTKTRTPPPPLDFDAIVASPSADAEVEVELARARAYVARLDAAGNGNGKAQGHAFVNGKHFDVDDNFWRAMQGEVAQQLQYFQEARQTPEEIAAPGVIENYFYDLPTSSARRNRYIFPASGPGAGGAELRIVNLPEVFGRTGFRVAPGTFVYPPETERIPLTMYVVADLDTEAGLGLVKEALSSIDDASKTRVSFVHNPAQAASAQIPASIPLKDDVTDLTDGVGLSGYGAEDYARFVRSSRLLARELQLKPGELGLVVNGRVVGPIEAGDFGVVDFKTLESYELRRRTEPVIKALESVKPAFMESDRYGIFLASYLDGVSVLATLYAPEANGAVFSTRRSGQAEELRDTGRSVLVCIIYCCSYLLTLRASSSFQFGNNSTALYHIAVILDPLSEVGQRWSSLLEWLSHIPDMYIKVYINPQHTRRSIPLKRFYRYALLPSLTFDTEGAEVPAQAIFDGLPIEPIYTLGMDVPPQALYDLDNIQLGSLSPQDTSVDAVFGLDYIVVDGHARDSLTNAPPRGVQLQLLNGGGDGTPVDDTQVVANLGYLQFKAKPGVFQLEIRQGRGRDIFAMESVGGEGLDSRTVAEVGNEIAVTSFEGLTIYPRLSRLPGMEREDVLAGPEEDEAEPAGMFEDIASRVKSLFFKETPAPTALVPVSGQADINIFTVASGLLYERFVSIMILSVLRNTNSTVKFWFIENFLSPSFLEFIPHLAAAYNFQYELVTYKWPSWLRAQKEKQRIIWAYKILFLDVLFPMDLKKVIFVDADQIVRADLKELVDLDLHGAPYGYTPMGDDNTDMEGFRALYVIDLVRFRKDILRGSYQQLSADPGSLANLDQDLPNNLQREFSLPEDWLWVSSKERLHRAKTIDLCQNPLTKEPKLVRARQIPEWEEYDSEISRFARKLAEEGVIRSRMVAADANALAASGAGGSQPDINVIMSSPLRTPSDLPAISPQADSLDRPSARNCMKSRDHSVAEGDSHYER